MRFGTIVGAIGLVAAGAGAFAQQPAAGRQVAVEGKVIDAACFMMHPDAATLPSHEDCGKACLARGVPAAILNDADEQLYFPADGNKQLAPHLHHRVKASGTAVWKTEPMELKMAVGDKNEMAVKVTGGYNVLTIDKLTMASK
jgi:hypothetical protein